MEPLSVRLLDFIRRNPGAFGDRVIAEVLDFRTEKASDAERILQVLENTGRIYACEIYDPERRGFVSFYYPFDAVPTFASPSAEKEALRCPSRPSWRTVYHPFAIPSLITRREVRKEWEANGRSSRSCPRTSS